MKNSKYLVFKIEDCVKYLSETNKLNLDNIIDSIILGRLTDNKPLNEYLVINQDEKYSDKVIELMKKNGQWEMDT